ncbi:phenylalanine--tRNA ligase subunit beta [Yimella sp. cx-51]|uniref:phenylalanine--tRNA ligase subunit beta n=1 Tax=Yimella sp. cx-51 TaxID=2770551 RepID=UPI00165E8AFA|nr:phenylalanine--tRNA ligase subunit beta [Yimella sp. cx-51]MBC9956995.1 phenylalanine--tRNA ligase subunit beta [Yimella sp. cx-51]QTH39209.1 phenylalanine--tRNA ligase subunit beta [Yimella sp. cx-51]
MRVPIDWLREYVAVPTDARGVDVAAALVKVGLEEEGIHGGDITGPLVVGRVISKEPEEQKNGKTINWCQVDVGDANGNGEPQGIVCGAHNFDAGDWVVCVLPGAVLPGGFEISARKTYGHVSAGMICAADELGLPDDGSGGIIRLSEILPGVELTPGQDALPLLGLDRETVEINVTPDRGYCFCIRGVAREYSHSTGAQFVDPALALAAKAPTATGSGFGVEVDDQHPMNDNLGCTRYVARIVRGIDPSAPTPAWMATRLTEAGMRPISLAVDITNYVMLALGQPLHAFDVDTLTGPIVVRRARQGEQLKTLDDVDRSLFAEDLLITDAGEKPLAIAGVMGGEDSEVSDSTRSVLIEAARFDPTSIARSARRHKLATEASKRFERGVDPELAPAAAQLAVDLLVEFGGGTADEAVTDVYTPLVRPVIELDADQPSKVVGVDYTCEQVVSVLEQIGCAVEQPGDHLRVTPPTWRPDLTTWPDLVEEVARIQGYASIPSIVPAAPGGRGLTDAQRGRRIAANVLAAQGFTEIWSAPFVSEKSFDLLGYAANDVRRTTVRVANPLSEEEPLIRTAVLPNVLDALRRNVSRGQHEVALFEHGLVIAGPAGRAPTYPVGTYPGAEAVAQIEEAVPAQPRHLAWAMTGEQDHSGWWGKGRSADWADAIAVARSLADALAVPLQVRTGAVMPFHPGRCAELVLANGTVIGAAGELHPKVVSALGLSGRPVGGELDLDALVAAAGNPQAVGLSNFPIVQSDVALTVDSAVRAGEVLETLRSAAGAELEAIELFDSYEGDQVGQGKKSLAFRMTFRGHRTLKTDEVNQWRDAAVSAAGRVHGAVQRGA